MPNQAQGRVFGALGAMSEALRPLGLVLAAPLLAFAGVPGSFLAVGAGIVVTTLIFGRSKKRADADQSEAGSWRELSVLLTPRGRQDRTARDR